MTSRDEEPSARVMLKKETLFGTPRHKTVVSAVPDTASVPQQGPGDIAAIALPGDALSLAAVQTDSRPKLDPRSVLPERSQVYTGWGLLY